MGRVRPVRRVWPAAVGIVLALAAISVAAQRIHEAPERAPSTGTLVPPGEPGEPLNVSGVVVGPDGAPIANAWLYVYQTDHEGYYGVKPQSDSRTPRLKAFLRSDARGAWSFTTVKPGSYPDSKAPAHIHFEVMAPGREPKVFEIVFEGDPFITRDMRANAAFSVRRIQDGSVTERIVLD